ncbi:MAG: PHP domain-containing protein [Dictyoglomaceae bacterium]|nr:PHP domain-containing protein [Dictyoglomaceae bacterium]
MLKWYGIDLHIHTVLSPCGDWGMTPKVIVERAKVKNIDIIAITDHHMVENYPAVKYWGDKMGVFILPGIEIQSREEAHIVGIFKDYLYALNFQKELWNFLPNLKNDENLFGIQVVVNEKDEVERIEERLLSISVSLSIEEILTMIKKMEGISILAHIDRPVYSVISTLGFIPEYLEYDIIEFSKKVNLQKFLEEQPNLRNKPYIISSDAHYINDIMEPKSFLSLEGFSWNNFLRAIKENNIKNKVEV